MCLCCSLCVRPWHDVLLVSVMKGQNVLGFRKDKGRKDVLFEQIPVVRLRTELLQQQRRCTMAEPSRFIQANEHRKEAYLWCLQVQGVVPLPPGDPERRLHAVSDDDHVPVRLNIYCRVWSGGKGLLSPSLQQLRDLIPFFRSIDGDLTSAVHSMFPSVKAPVARLTPPLFAVYLRIFETATAPKLVVSHPLQLCCAGATWEPIKG